MSVLTNEMRAHLLKQTALTITESEFSAMGALSARLAQVSNSKPNAMVDTTNHNHYNPIVAQWQENMSILMDADTKRWLAPILCALINSLNQNEITIEQATIDFNRAVYAGQR